MTGQRGPPVKPKKTSAPDPLASVLEKRRWTLALTGEPSKETSVTSTAAGEEASCTVSSPFRKHPKKADRDIAQRSRAE